MDLKEMARNAIDLVAAVQMRLPVFFLAPFLLHRCRYHRQTGLLALPVVTPHLSFELPLILFVHT